ncbi:homeobox-leucine zipper protein ROC8-like [Apium graveolens]|uniref:homeobox-leucine zipper protein ROC8-like n=1 Tax=Apium graveolens TaxID=4045 RepID=UPI003D7ABBCE
MTNMIRFVDPSIIGAIGCGTALQRSRALAAQFKDAKKGQYFLMPYNDVAIKFYKEDLNKLAKKKILWENMAGVPVQAGTKECGLFVIRYMKEIIEDKELEFAAKGVSGMSPSRRENEDGANLKYENIVANYKPLMVDVFRNAMDELIKLVQSDSPFWIRSSADGRQVLNLECYESIFPGVAKSPNVRIESSKDSSVVIIDSLELVDMFMDANKWMEFFPNIVSRATTLEVVSSGLTGSRSGLLQLMYEELQVLSPLVPTRKFYFLRFCEQIEQHTWAIVDVSYNFPQEPFSNSQSPVRLLPSGCLIQDMLNGCSKITWIEHMEIEDIRPIHNLYMKHVCSGLAFGATRKLATLRRTCERLSCLMDVSNTSYFGGVITSTHGKRNLMKLSQRMVKTFCSSINTVNGQQVMISGINDLEVCAMLQRCTDPGHPNSIVLSAATTISVPFASVEVFNFFRDGRNQPLVRFMIQSFFFWCKASYAYHSYK